MKTLISLIENIQIDNNLLKKSKDFDRIIIFER